MKKVVWGVLSTASIGMQKVLPAMQQSAWCDLRAIASRSLDSARKAADRLGIERAYGSYEALIADPQIEAIYNPLPNHLHVPLTLAAAAAGAVGGSDRDRRGRLERAHGGDRDPRERLARPRG